MNTSKMHNREDIKIFPSVSPRLATWGSTEDNLAYLRSLEQGVLDRTLAQRTAAVRAVPGLWVWSASAALTLVLVLLMLSCQAASAGHPVTYDPDPPLPLHRCLVSSIVPPGTCWIPDLTDVGVEPNPGPVTTSTPSSRKRGKATGKKTVTIIKQAPRPTIKSVIRSAVGPKESIGRRFGGWVGDMAQKAIMAITGFGDYTVRANTLTNGGSPPAFAMGKHMTKVCHREFVGIVSTPGSQFNITAYPISPKTYLFPWLSEIALSFEQFAIRGMVVEFKTTSATAVSSTNTALGSVIIATQYNVLAPPFTTQQQMEAYEYCTSSVPSQSMIHPIECAPNLTAMTELYMDSGSVGDPRLEYLGTTYVATVGQQAASVIGELWVSYEIDLIKPKLFSGVATQGLAAHFQINQNSNNSFTLSRPMAQLVNASPVAGSDLPVTIPSYTTLSFPGWLTGYYQITLNRQITMPASTTGSWTTGGAVGIVSGAGQVRSPWISSAVISTFGQFQSPLAQTMPSVASPVTYSLTSTWFLYLPGSNPSIPVVVNWTVCADVSTGASGIGVADDLWVNQISVAN
jgi:hypothetical protein